MQAERVLFYLVHTLLWTISKNVFFFVFFFFCFFFFRKMLFSKKCVFTTVAWIRRLLPSFLLNLDNSCISSLFSNFLNTTLLYLVPKNSRLQFQSRNYGFSQKLKTTTDFDTNIIKRRAQFASPQITLRNQRIQHDSNVPSL